MRFRLNWHQDRELNDRTHFIIVNMGGYGSGKSQTIPLIMRKRSEFDTSQRHGLFANTITQINEGILPDIYEWLDKLGIEYVFGSKPPAEWLKLWRKVGIEYPHRGPRSPHTLILKSGLHTICAGLANNAYKRFKGFRFGSVIIEEITELQNADPIRFLLPRIRCGDFGSGVCEAQHRHQLYLHGNPPDPRQPHWVRDWIREMNREEFERMKKGEPPFFMYLRSSTYDNVENVGPDYIRRLRQGLDKDTAETYITGSLEQVSAATTYYSWSRDNVMPIKYDPDRSIQVAMDFNVWPAASTLGHELLPNEIPREHQGSELTAVGIFGEFASRQNMTAVRHARALLDGDRDKGGHWPENFKGLLKHRGPIYMYGDPSGHQKRVESDDLRSAWAQINDVLMPVLGKRYHFDVPRNPPSIYESITILNSKLRSDTGEISYFVDPRCTELIKDFEQVVPRADGSDWIDKRKDGGRTHWSDAERYKVWVRYPGSRRNNLKAMKTMLAESVTFSPLTKLGELPPVLGRP